ncbi:unnamed protein product [Caenorhabditis bovis]|uniref:Uncharacterized protein n=1 Tax=Caenorhabditis bovis TaxID=2654633 RepID=A0A8S1ER94_9PELO|nr:unnamed protein product [Caenorhabditis bovis]
MTEEAVVEDLSEYQEEGYDMNEAREDGVNYIAAIFAFNNVSGTLGQDIFGIAKVLNIFSSISAILQPYAIWIYSLRPNTNRKFDKHFIPIPDKVAEVLCDFGLDALGLYLPEDLLIGDIPTDK